MAPEVHKRFYLILGSTEGVQYAVQKTPIRVFYALLHTEPSVH